MQGLKEGYAETGGVYMTSPLDSQSTPEIFNVAPSSSCPFASQECSYTHSLFVVDDNKQDWIFAQFCMGMIYGVFDGNYLYIHCVKTISVNIRRRRSQRVARSGIITYHP